jgi:ribonucleoside-diphosphate reductase beta chain
MIQRDNANARVVQAAIDKYAPTSIEAISPAPEQMQRMLANGLDPWITPRYAVESLTKKLRVIGLSMKLNLPEIPPEPEWGL